MSELHSMESFPGVAGRVLQEFRTLLQHGPSLLGSTHMLQIITINMFIIHNNHSRGKAVVFTIQLQVLTQFGGQITLKCLLFDFLFLR